MSGQTITLGVSDAQLGRLNMMFQRFPREAMRNARLAVNDALTKARTETKRIIAAELGVSGADLVRPHRFGAVGSQSTGVAIRIEKMKSTAIVAEGHLWITGNRIPVVFFKRTKPSRPGEGLTVQRPILVRAKGKTFIARRRGTGVTWRIGNRSGSSKQAFVSQMKSGHVGVFQRRRGAKRLKITELKGPSIPGVAEKNPKFAKAMDVDIRQYFARRLDHYIEQTIKGTKF